jgi:hypothetical protein
LALSREELEKNAVNLEAVAATEGRPIARRLGFGIYRKSQRQRSANSVRSMTHLIACCVRGQSLSEFHAGVEHRLGVDSDPASCQQRSNGHE